MKRAGVVLALVVAAACGADRPRPERATDSSSTTPSSLIRLARDSALADSIALATLPPRQRVDFALEHLFAAAQRGDSGVARCETLSQLAERELRIRMRARDQGNLAVVLFARAEQTTGTLRRVELARRTADGGQLGYTWGEEAGALTALEWAPGQSDPTQYEMPVGTPTPRALRALGRRLLMTCGPANATGQGPSDEPSATSDQLTANP